MSWTEKLADRLAAKLVTEDTPYTRGQIAHGLEIVLLQLLNLAFLLVVSYLLDAFGEALVVAVVYTLHRNFTGGVHFKSQSACFYIGNALLIGAALLVKYLPPLADAAAYGLVLSVFALSFALNRRYAPAKHTYVEYDESIIKRNRTIVGRLLVFGCLFSLVLVYFSYSKLAFSYTVAVLLQSILLHPFSYRLVGGIEQIFNKGVDP
ncbi:accessory gene regulator ArgB-like protein [Brevibacillus marinus]|uniref:accessory gene regulator ArgB-like protein n=1 Tax=Brevibacillus marinus TaxID=2496837 RepID=UPI000F82807D|nr:accessory gene regulator B family protein [Brevibacillus marinus]